MGLLDTIFGAAGSNVDVAGLAAKAGVSPEVAEQAVVALSAAHSQPTDTITMASQQTGLDPSTLQTIVDHVGGEGAVARFNQILQDHPQAGVLLSLLDRDGDGAFIDDIAGFAARLIQRSK